MINLIKKVRYKEVLRFGIWLKRYDIKKDLWFGIWLKGTASFTIGVWLKGVDGEMEVYYS